jgi:hypothetical protein
MLRTSILAVAIMLSSVGCGDPYVASCNAPDPALALGYEGSQCFDFHAGITATLVHAMCLDTYGGTTTHTPCPSANRVGRCRGVNLSSGEIRTVTYYAPHFTTINAQADCNSGPPGLASSTFTPN